MPSTFPGFVRVAVLAVAAGAPAFSGCIFQPERPAFRANAQWVGQYNHRGMVQNDRGGFQPEMGADLATKSEGLVRLKAWGHMDLSNDTGNAWFPDGKAARFSEIDLIASYFHKYERLEAEVGVNSYNLPNANEFPLGARSSTTEMFALVGVDVYQEEWWGFRPSGGLHADYDQSNGLYVDFGVSKSVSLGSLVEGLSINGAIFAGYSDEGHSWWAYGLEDVGLADVRGNLNVSYSFDPQFRVFAGVNGSTIVDSEIRDWFELINIDPDNVWANVGCGWTF